MTALWRWLWAAPWTLFGLAIGGVAGLFGARAQVVHGAVEISGGRLGRWAARGLGRNGLNAITLGHVILGCDAATLAALRPHEQVHVRQYERWGPLFVPAYWLASAWVGLRGGDVYRDNPFEREAFAAEQAKPKP